VTKKAKREPTEKRRGNVLGKKGTGRCYAGTLSPGYENLQGDEKKPRRSESSKSPQIHCTGAPYSRVKRVSGKSSLGGKEGGPE